MQGGTLGVLPRSGPALAPRKFCVGPRLDLFPGNLKGLARVSRRSHQFRTRTLSKDNERCRTNAKMQRKINGRDLGGMQSPRSNVSTLDAISSRCRSAFLRPISISPTGRPSTGNGSEIDGQSSKLAMRGLRSTRPLSSWNAASSATAEISGARIGVAGSTKTSLLPKDCSKDRTAACRSRIMRT